VGGRTAEVPTVGGHTRLLCMDGADKAANCMESAAELPTPGDHVWWQGRHTRWMPQDCRFTEWPHARVGYRFDPQRCPGVGPPARGCPRTRPSCAPLRRSRPPPRGGQSNGARRHVGERGMDTPRCAGIVCLERAAFAGQFGRLAAEEEEGGA